MNRERFQAFCRKCFQSFESDTILSAIAKASEHEASGKCPGHPVNPDKRKSAPV